MYNPAKISRRRTTPKDLNIQFTVSVINIAMHYIYLQLISVLIYYTLKKKNQKTKHSIFFKLLHILIVVEFFCVFFPSSFLKNKPETLGL